MEDFSNDLFSSFFDDPVLDEKSPLLDMELDSPAPGIQAEHSYSLSGDSAPQSPLVPIKMEDTTQGKMCQGPGGRKLLRGQAESGVCPQNPSSRAAPGLLAHPGCGQQAAHTEWSLGSSVTDGFSQVQSLGAAGGACHMGKRTDKNWVVVGPVTIGHVHRGE